MKNRRVFSKNHPMRSAFGIVLTIVLAAFCGIVGYSVIAPIYERFTAEAENPTTVPDPFDASSAAESSHSTAQTTMTVTAEDTMIQTTTTISIRSLDFDEDTTLIYCVSAEDMTDLSVLEQTAVAASNLGFHALAFPLKTAGGSLTYVSEVEAAINSGASQEDYLSLVQLSQIAEENGMDYTAIFDVLNDQTYPAVYQDGAYTIAESGLRWLDMSFEGGGKPWMSPFSPQARSYLISLAAEISSADFASVFCTDLIFPNFYDSDVSYIGEQVSDPAQRSDALASVMNDISESVPGAVYTFDFWDAIGGSEETLNSSSLNTDMFCVQFDLTSSPDSFIWNGTPYNLSGISESEKAAQCLSVAQMISGDRMLYPWVVRGTMSEEELAEVLQLFYDSGCRMILVSDK